MKTKHWVAIAGLSLSGACTGMDSSALFGDVAEGGAAPATDFSAAGNAGSPPQNTPVAVAGVSTSTAGNSSDSPDAAPRAGGEGGARDLAGEGGGQPVAGSGGGLSLPTCADTCMNGTCTMTGAADQCLCLPGFVPEGVSCRRPKSCLELYRAAPSLASGAYTLQPATAKAAFQSYCLMSAEGGGWTLILNHGTEFDPNAMGSGAELGFENKGTNLAYSAVVLESDVMLDVRMDAIVSETYTARAIISGVHAGSRGHTLRELFTSGPHYVEAEDNSNLKLSSSIQCSFSPVELAPLFCQSAVIVFGNQESNCPSAVPRFAISGAGSYTMPWSNCAGWPQATVVNGQQHFPNNFRVWIR